MARDDQPRLEPRTDIGLVHPNAAGHRHDIGVSTRRYRVGGGLRDGDGEGVFRGRRRLQYDGAAGRSGRRPHD